MIVVARVHKIGRLVALMALRVVAVGLLVVAGGGLVAGWQVLDVQGGSMEPTIANGSVLLTIPADASDVHPGDVVSFIGADGARVTHRVVDIDPATGALTTRGDANDVDDAVPYAGDSVDQVKVAVPFIGPAYRLLTLTARNPLIWAGAIALALALAPWGNLNQRRRRHVASTPIESAIREHADALVHGTATAHGDVVATGGPGVTRRQIHRAPAGRVAAGGATAGPVSLDARGATVDAGRAGVHYRPLGDAIAGRRQAKAVGAGHRADRVTLQVTT